MADDSDSKVTVGSGNVFRDLDLEDAEMLQLKSDLIVSLHRAIKAKSMTQQQAAKAIGMSQPKISRLLAGKFVEVSVDRLFRALTDLGVDIDIVIGKSRSDGAGRITYNDTALEQR
jgi:predicted XRE-type DNA-binding protein